MELAKTDVTVTANVDRGIGAFKQLVKNNVCRTANAKVNKCAPQQD
jgi:hypothetical protein